MSNGRPGTARLIVVRHGQTAHNLERRLQGHVDTPLDGTGMEQAARLAAHFQRLGIAAPTIHASDLKRAAATAQALHKQLGGSLTLFPELREICLGDWESGLHDELQDRYGELFTRFWAGDPDCRAPNAETPREVGERLLAHVLAHWPQADEALLVVTHGIALTALLTRLLGLDYQDTWSRRHLLHGNTAYSVLHVDPETREVLATELAQAGHLALA